jgi:hypothetical protein
MNPLAGMAAGITENMTADRECQRGGSSNTETGSALRLNRNPARVFTMFVFPLSDNRLGLENGFNRRVKFQKSAAVFQPVDK